MIKEIRHTSVDTLTWDIASIERSAGSNILRKSAMIMLKVNVKERVAQEDIPKHVNGSEEQVGAEEKKNAAFRMTLESAIGRQLINYRI